MIEQPKSRIDHLPFTTEQEANSFFRALSTCCPVGVFATDSEGRCTYVNPRCQSIWGASSEESLGQYWTHFIDPSDREVVLAAWRVCTQNDQEFCYQCQLPTQLWVNVLSAPLWGDAGHVIGHVHTLEDITEQKRIEAAIALDLLERQQAEEALRQSEEQFRQLANAMPQIVWVSNANGQLEYVNRHWLDFAGLTLEEGRNRKLSSQVIHPDDVQAAYQQWQISLADKIPYQQECRLKRAADGAYRWFLVRAVPSLDEAGQVIQWYGTSTDIDDRKQAEVEREQLLQREQLARAEAEAANHTKDQFLAVLSHELRSPLNPILGWTQLLQSRKLTETQVAQALVTIERNAKLQTQLIDDLLDVSRILRDKLNLNLVSVNLSFIINAAIETVRTMADVKAITIRTTLSDVAPVLGDPARLQQIVWNLLANAIKFTPERGRVEVRLEQVGGIGNQEQEVGEASISSMPAYAQITVSDTGKGIDPEFLPYVFEYFRQADASTTRQHGGLGLGLAIVRHLVELHGGMVAADSPGEGQGATFTVRLPLSKIQPAIEEPELFNHEPNLAGVRILVVEDDADSRELLGFALELYGAMLVTAASVPEALALLERFQPDVLISDIGMPGEDGYELIRQVRACEPDASSRILAIALTAYVRAEDKQKALSAGFQEHMPKPVEPAVLATMIIKLLRGGARSQSVRNS